jgi:hypothetical protein
MMKPSMLDERHVEIVNCACLCFAFLPHMLLLCQSPVESNFPNAFVPDERDINFTIKCPVLGGGCGHFRGGDKGWRGLKGVQYGGTGGGRNTGTNDYRTALRLWCSSASASNSK